MKKDQGIDSKFPDARIKGISEIFEFIQDRSWEPEVINVTLLKRLGIASSNESRVVAALRFLGIIDEAGVPTQVFTGLKNTYSPLLAEQVKGSYSELFRMIPTRLVTEARLMSFFGEPAESAEYKAKLFEWLCRESDINLENIHQEPRPNPRAKISRIKTKRANTEMVKEEKSE